MANFIPRLVLPALPAPVSKDFGSRRRKIRANSVAVKARDAPDEIFSRGLLLAIQDMQSLLGHVCALLNGPYSQELGITEWLKQLDEVLVQLEDATVSGKFTSADHLTIDDDGPADLDFVLQHAWESDDHEWTEGVEFDLLAKLVQYWLHQIRHRGYSLLHLLIGADDIVSAVQSLTDIKEIRYPIS